MVTLFGGTRFWAAGPFWLPVLMALGAFLAVTFVRTWKTSAGLCLPRDFFFWSLILLYVAIRAAFFTPIAFETWTELLFLLTAWLLYGVLSDVGNQASSWTLGSFIILSWVLIQSLYAISHHWHGNTMVLYLPRPAQYGMRASGTYICPNHFAHFILMGMVLAFALVFTPRVRLGLRIFAGYVFIPATIALILSHSRSGMIGAFAGISAVCLGKALRKGWKRVVCILLLLTLMGAGCIFALLQFYPPMRARMVRDVQNNIRISQVWPDTWRMIEGEGFWGAGPGVYINVFEKYREHFSSSRLHLEYAHNEFLNTLAEYGWAASAVFLLLLGWLFARWIRAAVKSESDQTAMIPITMLGLSAGTFAHAFFDFNLHIPANGLLFVALIGWLTGVGIYRHVWKNLRPISTLKLRCYALFGFVACLVMIPFVTRMMVGGWYEYRMIKAEEQAELVEKAAYSEKMRAWMPWASRGWMEMGNELREKAFWEQGSEKQQFITASREAYEKALALNNYDSEAQQGLVELARIEKRPEQALVEVRRLLELTPFELQVRIQYGLILRELDRPEEALEVFEAAQRLDAPFSKQVDLNIRRLRQIIKQKTEEAK